MNALPKAELRPNKEHDVGRDAGYFEVTKAGQILNGVAVEVGDILWSTSTGDSGRISFIAKRSRNGGKRESLGGFSGGPFLRNHVTDWTPIIRRPRFQEPTNA